MTPRTCKACGCSLAGRDPRARTCSPACRREAARIARLCGGLPDSGYLTLAEYLARRRRCVQNAHAGSTVPADKSSGAAPAGTGRRRWPPGGQS